MQTWHPNSWTTKKNSQLITYSNQQNLATCVEKINNSPKLVQVKHINHLKLLLAEASRGNAFILQGGDCAEVFNLPLAKSLNTVNLLNKLSNIIAKNINIPVIPVGRIAGQFAKPRTTLYEQEHSMMLSYRGDLINKRNQDISSRIPDPNNLLRGYNKASQIYSILNELPEKVIADFNNLIVPNIFTSHEALNLNYEQALTHQSFDNNWYNFSTHFPWIGVRTNQVDNAQIEYLRGINNPIGIKIGPITTIEHALSLLKLLNPKNIPGKITFITRFGCDNTLNQLPKLIEAIKKSNSAVTWLCDPMHGNTKKTKNGIKERSITNIEKELIDSIDIHKKYNSILAGIHLELTTENICECKTNENDQLSVALVDPRLNQNQSKKVIETMCQYLRRENNE